jgi:K+-sensing histidine kinase KdpD
LLHKHQHAFIGTVTILEWPRYRSIKVPALVYPLLDHTISGLFLNVINYGGNQVRVRCTVDRRKLMTLNVIDNGPGFDQTVFDDQSTNLHWRRIDAQAMGGDLTMERTNEGTDVCLVVSLKRPSRRERRRLMPPYRR